MERILSYWSKSYTLNCFGNHLSQHFQKNNNSNRQNLYQLDHDPRIIFLGSFQPIKLEAKKQVIFDHVAFMKPFAKWSFSQLFKILHFLSITSFFTFFLAYRKSRILSEAMLQSNCDILFCLLSFIFLTNGDRIF